MPQSNIQEVLNKQVKGKDISFDFFDTNGQTYYHFLGVANVLDINQEKMVMTFEGMMIPDQKGASNLEFLEHKFNNDPVRVQIKNQLSWITHIPAIATNIADKIFARYSVRVPKVVIDGRELLYMTDKAQVGPFRNHLYQLEDLDSINDLEALIEPCEEPRH